MNRHRHFYLMFILFCFLTEIAFAGRDELHPRLRPFVDVIKNEGQAPIPYIISTLDKVDLILFDDAWHPALEPFQFYQSLLRTPAFREKVKYIFLEVVPVNRQHCIDAYLNAEQEDVALLYPAFQDDFSGFGWDMQTYFDLLATVYQVNQQLPPAEKIKVFAVNAPVFWQEIHTAEDLQLFRKSLTGNDYTMYKIILAEMDHFQSGRKGIFLTNTRHAYKGIKDRNGQYFWNCGTFFHQWHPGKTASIRFHQMALHISREKSLDPETAQSTAGTERYDYQWVRMLEGLWDSAFEATGNSPVAIPLQNNVFGNTPYVGNHMHKAMPGQKMSAANDAIIFLAPLEELHNTALTDIIYTPAFKQELARRLPILYTPEQLAQKFESYEVNSITALVEKLSTARAQLLIPQARMLPPKTAWLGKR